MMRIRLSERSVYDMTSTQFLDEVLEFEKRTSRKNYSKRRAERKLLKWRRQIHHRIRGREGRAVRRRRHSFGSNSYASGAGL